MMLPGSRGRFSFRIASDVRGAKVSGGTGGGAPRGLFAWITGRGGDRGYGEGDLSAASLVLPLLLLAAAVFIEVLARSISLYDQRQRLDQLLEAQQPRYETALRLQSQFDGIAAGTARLARGGNSNAIEVIERLQALGITVSPDAGNTDSSER